MTTEARLRAAYDAAVLAIKAMNVPRDHPLNVDALVKARDAYDSKSGTGLGALVARTGKSPKAQVLKARLHELVQG